jgi:uncharacterized protein YjiS (DUF1127 family)
MILLTIPSNGDPHLDRSPGNATGSDAALPAPQTLEALGPKTPWNTYKGTLPMLMSLVLRKVQRWLTDRETVRELESLSERELSDLGIGRADIRDIARHATR